MDEEQNLDDRFIDLFTTLINENAGWLSFAQFMHHVLYEPKIGYYSGGRQKFGHGGDFITAPELSPLFGRCLARQVAEVLSQTQEGVLELGAGSGRLACDVLRELERIGDLPRNYFILEPSPELISRQKETLMVLDPDVRNRVSWIGELPKNFTGVMVANEVFDALPVHLMVKSETGWMERGVTISGGQLTWSDRLFSDHRLTKAVDQLDVPAPYLTELCVASDGLVRDLAESLSQGCIFVIDYGYEQLSYYHPERSSGTLACHHEHQTDGNPLTLLGQKDITAHVNFTRLGSVAIDHGLDVSGYASQADFLVNCGITKFLEELDPESVETYLPVVSSVQKLLSPEIMGDIFKVMCLSRDIENPLMGFRHGDRRHRL